MLKKLIYGCCVALVAILLYTTVIPAMLSPKEMLGDPTTRQAILDFASTQMKKRSFGVPQDALEWKLEDIKIHKITELPGPHNRKEAIVTLSGYYLLPAKEFRQPKQRNIKFKGKFNYGSKYPSGISVQYIPR